MTALCVSPVSRVRRSRRQGGNPLRKVYGVALAALLAVGLFAQAAFAASPHFLRASAARSGNNLVVSFKEAGLGNTNITIQASALATRTDQCVNKGGNVPSDPKKTTTSSTTSATGVFSPKNGSVTGSLTLNPPATTLKCPGGQRATLVSLSYTNVVVRDLTNNVSKSIPGTF